MQCAACRAVYSHEFDVCPRCQRPAQKAAPASEKITTDAPRPEHKAAANAAAAAANSAHHVAAPAATDESATTTATATLAPPSGSTLIEFPGTGRAARPQWRKELSERVREIQQRRAREAQEAEEAARRQPNYIEQAEAAVPAPPLGLVPPREDAPPLNPLVAAALRRIERARQSSPPMPRASSGRAATAAAVARVAEESYQPAVEPSLVVPPPVAPPRPAPSRPLAAPATSPVAEAQRAPHTAKTEMTADALHASGESLRASSVEAQRASALVALPSQPPVKAEPASDSSKTETPAGAVARAASIAAPADAKIETAAQASTATTNAAAAQAAPSATATTVTASPSSPASKTMTNATPPRRVFSGVVDELSLEQREAEITEAANTVPVVTAAEIYDDRAPKSGRIVASVLDVMVVAFFSSPFAAIIELTSGRWHDPRVQASMGGIVLVVMFLYLAGSTALAGCTWGMSLFSLRAVDARTALAPTTGQAIRRAVFYMLSLITLGVPILYALIDAEGRTAHDHLSGTIIVRE